MRCYNVVVTSDELAAAIFFTGYETIKTHLPTDPHLAPFSHFLAASASETVRPQCFVMRSKRNTDA